MVKQTAQLFIKALIIGILVNTTLQKIPETTNNQSLHSPSVNQASVDSVVKK